MMALGVAAPEALDADLEQQFRRDMRRAFRARLQGDVWLVLLGHLALLALVTVLSWGSADGRLIWWVAAVVVTTAARSLWFRRSARRELSDRHLVIGARVVAAAHGLAWGLGAATVLPFLPMPDVAIVLAILAGIGAGAVATMAPDPPSFYLLIAAMAGPLPAGILLGGRDRPHVLAVLVVAVFTVVMLVLYRRAHAAFGEQVLTVLHRTRAEAERERAHEALRESEAQLRQAQKMEAVSQLAGGLAHDLNNLLTAVLASGDLLDLELAADSPLRPDVDTIGRAARRAGELTRKLLAFSRQHPLEVRRLSLATLARDFVHMVRRVVPEDVAVEVLVDPAETTIEADAGAIEQILMNLVTNARDAMPGGGRLAIEVRRVALDDEHCRVHGWGTPGDYAMLAVSDTGVGMDAETRQHVFEPFFTTKPPGAGTGLGMSVVYGLVKQHAGFVSVESEPGQGTTVRVYVPALAGEVVHAQRPGTPAVPGGTETILLVEDDEALRSATLRALRKSGYTVVPAVDGHEALTILDGLKAPPDLILSDVVMPRVSGPLLLSTLREAGPPPRMLFMSAYTSEELVERKKLEPGLPFLAKPWTLTDLLHKVREVLDAPPAAT